VCIERCMSASSLRSKSRVFLLDRPGRDGATDRGIGWDFKPDSFILFSPSLSAALTWSRYCHDCPSEEKACAAQEALAPMT
jgi:hypothetical protein